MATYRNGTWTTFYGDKYYVIQKKVFGVWITQSRYSNRYNMISAVK